MKLRAPSYAALAAVAYAIFAAWGLATWHTLLFVALPSKATAMSTLQELLATEPGTTLLKFHAAATLLALAFAMSLWLKPAATSRGKLLTLVAACFYAVGAWAVFWSETALLPTVAAAALAMSYLQAQPRGAQ